MAASTRRPGPKVKRTLAACWALIVAGAMAMLVTLVQPSGGPLVGIAIVVDLLPATALWALGVRQPFVREGGDAGVLTMLGVLVLYGFPLLATWWLRRRSYRATDHER